MATQASTLPAASRGNIVDEVSGWFWNFLKQELAPYPGRAWVVARVTIASTIVMLIVMTFKIPTGFLGAIFTVFISRENPTATFVSGIKSILAFAAATVYAAIGLTFLADDPLTHFLWIASSLFVCFYLIRAMADYGTAVAFGFLIAGAIPLWDVFTLNVEDRMENTLWTMFVVIIGIVVSIAVEYVFRGVHPASDLTEGIEYRLKTVETVLRDAAEQRPLDPETEKNITLYSTVGTSRLRRLIIRSDYGAHFKTQMTTAIALVGRLVDTSASFRLALAARNAATPIDGADRARCRRLADQIADLAKDLAQQQNPAQLDLPSEPKPSGLPFLAAMETTVAMVPKALAGSGAMDFYVVAPLEEEKPSRFFVADAFTNSAHIKFALRGTLAAMAAYVTYTSVAWPGLSTAIATCFITALSTIGSSRQKQILRLSGAFIGGFIFGMGSQVFVLPYLDSIFGFTILWIVVTAISSWIATASGRLSYLGVQLALAFYVINLQEFTIQTSLAVARDRVVGVLLGLVCMWLFFDRLWMRNALDEMQTLFARNLGMFAELTEQLLIEDQIAAMKRIRTLRDQLNAGFDAVKAQSDAVLFEFGAGRQRKLQLRDDIRRWQPSIRTLLLVQITSAQYLIQRPLKNLPASIAEAGVAFEQAIARVMRALADEVSGKPAGPVPELRHAAQEFNQAVASYYAGLGLVVPPEASDIAGLAESLASILAPLYEDIHGTFSGTATVSGGVLQLNQIVKA
jgi:multidrug resistance protein MdtO